MSETGRRFEQYGEEASIALIEEIFYRIGIAEGPVSDEVKQINVSSVLDTQPLETINLEG